MPVSPSPRASNLSTPNPILLLHRWTPAGLLLALWAYGLLLTNPGFAQASGEVAFDLPADFVEPTLKRFSAQSGLQVLFPTDAVAGVLTPPVRGVMSARQALNQLLAGSAFESVQDPKSGALTVRPKSAPPAVISPNHKDATSPTNASNPDPMKTTAARSAQSSVRPNKIAALVGAWLGVAAATGQSADSSPGRTTKEESDLITLSPFTVNSQQDTGYQALSTLAGTRLNSSLKDLGGAISIYTKDFLNDINATSSSDFLLYATGMEAAGPGGNFTAGQSDINASAPDPANYRREPQNLGSRSRGLAGPTFTRDFFRTRIASDSYNSDRATVLRGPNAALFGVASPAGVVDTSTLRPDLGADKSNVTFRYGNNDSVRTSVDFNRVLIKNKLAVRLAGLKADEEYNQRPAFEKKDRIFGAVTYSPYQNTTVRANFESGVQKANRPYPMIPALNSILNNWYAAGRPSFDWSFYDDPARNPRAASQVSTTELANFTYLRRMSLQPVAVFWNNPTDRQSAFAITGGLATTTNATTPNAILTSLFHPLLNRDVANDLPFFTETINIQEVPAAYWNGANLYPGQVAGLVPAGLKFQSFTDFSAFDWANRMIDESSRQSDNFHTFNVTFEQRAWRNRLGLELAYDQQRKDTRTRSSYFGGGTSTAGVRIDTSVTMPNGLPNPNLGRPFVSMINGGSYYHVGSDVRSYRASAFLKYDFKDLGPKWARWLGSHVLNGVAERSESVDMNYQTRFVFDGDYADRLNANFTGRLLTTVVYMGPSIIGNNNPLKLEPIRVPALDIGPAGQVAYFARQGVATDPGGFVQSPLDINWVNVNGRVSREVITSEAATLQSHWLQQHVVTMFGLRRDTDFLGTQPTNTVFNPAAPQDFGKIFWGIHDVNAIFPHTPARNVSAQSRSASVVAYWPRRLVALPRGTDLSVFYSTSENFTPVGGRVTYWNMSIEPPHGTTKEYGLNFSAWDDKLTIRFNQYETKSVGLSGGGLLSNPMGSFFPALAIRWMVEANTNPHLQAMRNADIALINDTLRTLPGAPDYLSIWQASVSGTVPNLIGTRASSVPGGGDTTDFVSKGQELDLIFNPSRNWRLLVNAAHQETVKSNIAPFAQQVYHLIMPVLEKLKDRSYTSYPVGWQPGTPLPANWQTLGQYVDATLRVPYATDRATEGDPSAEQRNWRANAVVNYKFTMSSPFGEWLKGWSIGGAVRWQSKMVVGLPSTRTADGGITFDRGHPFYAPAETNVDASLGYERRLWNGRVGWRVQLNGSNLYRERDLITVAIQPWGEVAAARPAPERRWYLTNSFSF